MRTASGVSSLARAGGRNFKTQKWRWIGAMFLFPDMTKL
jgi:hypothetical protein